MTSKLICRQCKLTLKFNNALHKHLKTYFFIINNLVVLYIDSKNFLSTIIKSLNVDVNKNTDIGYEFKDYRYASTEVILIENKKFIFIRANIEREITLTNI